MHKREILKGALAGGVLASPIGRVAAQADRPIRVGMTVSSTGTFALAARGQKVASAVIRADVADDQQLALDVLLDCVEKRVSKPPTRRKRGPE